MKRLGREQRRAIPFPFWKLAWNEGWCRGLTRGEIETRADFPRLGNWRCELSPVISWWWWGARADRGGFSNLFVLNE